MYPRNIIRRIQEKYHRGRYIRVREWVNGPCSLLDIGCGKPCAWMEDGSFLKFLGFGVGLDIKDYHGFKYVRGDVVRMPFDEKTFDVVTALEVLEHTGDIDKALREIDRVLKDEGTVIISTPKNNILWKMVWPVWERVFEKMWRNSHKQVLNERKWLEKFGKYFDIVEVKDHWNVIFIAKMIKKE